MNAAEEQTCLLQVSWLGGSEAKTSAGLLSVNQFAVFAHFQSLVEHFPQVSRVKHGIGVMQHVCCHMCSSDKPCYTQGELAKEAEVYPEADVVALKTELLESKETAEAESQVVLQACTSA